jgi:hypothetical protein
MNIVHLSCKLNNEYAIALPFSIDIIDHTSLFSIGPLYSSNLSNELDNNHSPLVRVVNNDLNHNKPLVGTENSKFVIQFSSYILFIIPFLFHSSAIIDHSIPLGTEIDTFSIGSIFTQFSSCIITTGAHT